MPPKSAAEDGHTLEGHGRREKAKARKKSPSSISSNLADGPPAPACDQCRIRKVRCDRLQPECSNCRRSGESCEFSNRGKRINHTKQLVDDFSTLAARLESIELSIDHISRHITGYRGIKPAGSESDGLDELYTQAGDESFGQLNAALQIEADEISSSRSKPTTGRVLPDGRGGQRFYGFPAALSLFWQTKETLADALSNSNKERSETNDPKISKCNPHKLSDFIRDNPSLRMSLQEAHQRFPLQFECTDPVFNTDAKPVACPPKHFVDSSLEIFLAYGNSDLPMFSEDRLRSAISEHYTKPIHEMCEVFNLCLNNIILLAMGLKSKVSTIQEQNAHNMDDELIGSFLSNSLRALKDLDKYIVPRVINLQAMFTLTLVACEYFENPLFEKLCQTSCYIVRIMGLETRSCGLVDKEKENLFWAVYVLDKQRTFLTGRPCDLYLFECDMQPTLPAKASDCRFPLARTHMMSLWEEMYLSLFSPRALKRPASHLQQQRQRLNTLFRAWIMQHSELINGIPENEPSARKVRRLELRYCCHVGLVLLSRGDPDRKCNQSFLWNLRASLGILQEIRSMPRTMENVNLLARLVRYYPIVPFHELHNHTIHSLDADSRKDIELIQSATAAVKDLYNPRFQTMYYARLHLGMKWIEEVSIKITDVAAQISSVMDKESQSTSPSSHESSRNKTPGSNANISPGPVNTLPARTRHWTEPQVSGSLESSGVTNSYNHLGPTTSSGAFAGSWSGYEETPFTVTTTGDSAHSTQVALPSSSTLLPIGPPNLDPVIPKPNVEPLTSLGQFSHHDHSHYQYHWIDQNMGAGIPDLGTGDELGAGASGIFFDPETLSKYTHMDIDFEGDGNESSTNNIHSASFPGLQDRRRD